MFSPVPPFRHPSTHAPRARRARHSCMRILFLVTMTLAFALGLTACGSPFLSEIGPGDAQDPVEAGTPEHHLGARHEAGVPDRDAGRDRRDPREASSDAGGDVVVELDAGDAQDAGDAAPPSDAQDDVVAVDDAGAPDVVTPPPDAADAGDEPDATAVDAAPLDAGLDQAVADSGAPDTSAPDAGAIPDSGSPDAAPSDAAPADAASPDAAADVVTVTDSGPVDSGPVDTGVDSACITPFAYYCAGGGLVANAPSEVCVYDEYFVSYSLGAVPYACQCATTFTCACLGYYGSTVCGGRSWSFCTDTGGGPQVTCD
jgi:hypothetical protein